MAGTRACRGAGSRSRPEGRTGLWAPHRVPTSPRPRPAAPTKTPRTERHYPVQDGTAWWSSAPAEWGWRSPASKQAEGRCCSPTTTRPRSPQRPQRRDPSSGRLLRRLGGRAGRGGHGAGERHAGCPPRACLARRLRHRRSWPWTCPAWRSCWKSPGASSPPGGAGVVIASMAAHLTSPVPSDQEQPFAITPTPQLLQLPFTSPDASATPVPPTASPSARTCCGSRRPPQRGGSGEPASTPSARCNLHRDGRVAADWKLAMCRPARRIPCWPAARSPPRSTGSSPAARALSLGPRGNAAPGAAGSCSATAYSQNTAPPRRCGAPRRSAHPAGKSPRTCHRTPAPRRASQAIPGVSTGSRSSAISPPKRLAPQSDPAGAAV